MNKTILVTLATLAMLGPASAGAQLHAFVSAEGETHSADVYAGDDGSLVILVDGEPIGVPPAPEVPGAPGLPGVPTPPATPELPTIPALPIGIPTLP